METQSRTGDLLRAGLGEEDGVRRGLGSGDVGVGARGGGPPEDTPQFPAEIKVRDFEPAAPQASPPRDFRINTAYRIGQGGVYDAIRTLRLVEDEGRAATRRVSKQSVDCW